MKPETLAAWLLSILLLVGCSASASTSVCGTIVNQIWTSNNSPYIVMCDINVAGLTILPGVTVRFAGNYAFEVDGVLQAQGTPNAPIIFMGTNGGWQGIYFNYSSPGSVLACCVISNSVNSGIRIIDSVPGIANCVIANNSAPLNGGGINASNSAGGNLMLQNCIISNNLVGVIPDGSLGGDLRNGGGVYAQLTTGALIMEGCLVRGNVVNPQFTNFGTYRGGGIYVSAGSSLLSYCVITSNVCCSVNYCGNNEFATGGGLYSFFGATALKNCIVSGNSVITDNGECPASASGGGIFAHGIAHVGSLSMTNCIVAHNTAASTTWQQAGGIFLSSTLGAESIVNCTVAYNNIEGIWSAPTAAQVMNSIFYFNNSSGTQIIGTTNVTYCDVQNRYAGTGNIDRNPVFLSLNDLIIVDGSPCIDAGNPSAAYKNLLLPPSLGTSFNDIGAHGGPQAGAIFQIQAWPQIEVFLFGAVPGYAYQIQASTNLLGGWQTVEQFQSAHVGEVTKFFEPTTNTLSRRFYKLNLAP